MVKPRFSVSFVVAPAAGNCQDVITVYGLRFVSSFRRYPDDYHNFNSSYPYP